MNIFLNNYEYQKPFHSKAKKLSFCNDSAKIKRILLGVQLDYSIISKKSNSSFFSTRSFNFRNDKSKIKGLLDGKEARAANYKKKNCINIDDFEAFFD